MAKQNEEKTYRVSFHMVGGDVVHVHEPATTRDEAKEKAQEEHHIPMVRKVTASPLKDASQGDDQVSLRWK